VNTRLLFFSMPRMDVGGKKIARQSHSIVSRQKKLSAAVHDTATTHKMLNKRALGVRERNWSPRRSTRGLADPWVIPPLPGIVPQSESQGPRPSSAHLTLIAEMYTGSLLTAVSAGVHLCR
jgi:hypothetical protein